MGRYLKANKSNRSPSQFVFFDTETKKLPIPDRPGDALHVLRLGYARTFRYERGRMTRRKEFDFTDHVNFWCWIDSLLSKHRPVWAIAHNMGFDATILRLWELVEDEYFTLKRYVDGESARFFVLSRPHGNLVLVDSLNWFRSSLERVGKDVGIEKLPVDFDNCTDKELSDHCVVDVSILEARFFSLLKWAKDNDIGVLQKTAPSQAFQAYKHRFAPRKEVARKRKQKGGGYKMEKVTVCYPLLHELPDVAEMERKAYFGGEARLFYVGQIRDRDNPFCTGLKPATSKYDYWQYGPVYDLDVNSLYPHVMKTYRYPCKYLSTVEEPSVSELTAFLGKYEAIAEVTLQTGEDSYPVRIDNSPRYACGVFQTALCGGELRYALERGSVRKVHRAAIYHTEDLFSEYVDFFWRLRMEARARGDKSEETLCKLMLVSLYGKFGARSYEWVDRPDVNAPYPWRMWYDATRKEEGMPIFRSIAWHTQQRAERGEGRDSFVAIPACVTSYGRDYMRRLRWIAREENVLYQHTDSLHVTADGFARLDREGLISTSELGKLKLVGTYKEAEYRGVSNYTRDGINVISGVKGEKEISSGLVYQQDSFDGLRRITSRRPLPGVMSRRIKINRERWHPVGRIESGGRVKPILLGVSNVL